MSEKITDERESNCLQTYNPFNLQIKKSKYIRVKVLF